jgi:RND family efflux transporter MFP subunit
MKIIASIKKLSLAQKIILSVIIIGLTIFGYSKFFGSKTQKATYQTAVVERGTLISSVSASGTITSGNNLSITTSATGTVGQVFVKNGDLVKKGQKIAEISLDQDGLQKQSQAWASYLSAKNSLDSARNKINSLQATEFSANQKFINGAVARDLETDDPTYIQENATWLQAENDYKNQFNVIEQSQASLTGSWYSYQQVSPHIVAPAAGIVSNLMITTGTVIASSGSTSTTSQKLATIKSQNENTQAQVTLSEIDATKVNPGQQVTITMDAFPEKTFTGKVLMVDTNGTVSSGVTAYPATIQFDTSTGNIYPNMGVNAKIIIDVHDNVLLVPSSAIQSSNDGKTVRTLAKGQLVSIPVEIGMVGDSQTEIISGVKEGDSVVTSVINATKTTTTASPFGSTGRGIGSGNVMIAR